jgi:DNA-binding FrmR family transcriptional regulator
MNSPGRAQRKIVNRLRRVQAQVDEIERRLSAGSAGMDVIMSLAKTRTEINGLMAEMLASRVHILLSSERNQVPPLQLGADLVDLLSPYLK